MKRQPRDHFVDANKMIDVRHRPPQWVTFRWGMGGALLTQGGALGYWVDAPLARKIFCTKGAKPHSPGQRHGNSPPSQLFSPNGAAPTSRIAGVTPRWGLEIVGWAQTRGDAPGYRVDATLARKNPRAHVAKPITIPGTNVAKPITIPGAHVAKPITIPRTKGAKPDTIPRTKGAKPHSLGQRPRFNAPPFSPSPERAKPNTEAHQ